MKGIKIGTALAAVMFLAVGSAYGFDIGNKIGNAAKDGVKAGSKMVVEKEINKNLAEKNCSFKPKTTQLTCDLSDILNTIKTQKTIAEKSGFANDVDIHAEVGEGKDAKNSGLGSDRAALVRNELRKKVSWWDWYDQSVPGDDLKIYIKIR